jgi:nitroreductase
MTETIPDAAVLKNALLLACHAPSVYNSQPWRWMAQGGILDLFVDPRRIAPRSDPSGREAIISCGCVLDHLHIAMAAAGWDAHVDRFPKPNNLDHLATIDFSPAGSITSAQCDRADAILQRATDRRPFAAPTHWDRFEPLLRATIDDSAAMLDVISDDDRPRLAEASQLSESLRRDDATFHAELRWWTSPSALSDGIPLSALVSEAEGQRVDVGRTFPIRHSHMRQAGIEQDHSKILVLSTVEDTRTDALGCGEALSAVLLECTMAGMATCTLTHMTEVDASREIVRGLIEKGRMPQVLLRVGTPPESDSYPPATPRRALADVLQFC